ncbi:hypothetical protein [Streptacidiphilus sp. EB103A]|uniref:hypothetical protein n=1 Tax=Streptacidiphilus sp. EB103A TaxID=3156275 RepID=UPI0035190BD1
MPRERKATTLSVTESPDRPLEAIRAALGAGGHDLGAILVNRLTADSVHVLVAFDPDGAQSWNREVQHRAYTETLTAAGWRPLNLELLVLLTPVPLDADSGTFTATWAIEVAGEDSEAVAEQARERQLDPAVTDSTWTVTDHLGRPRTVYVQDPDLS